MKQSTINKRRETSSRVGKGKSKYALKKAQQAAGNYSPNSPMKVVGEVDVTE